MRDCRRTRAAILASLDREIELTEALRVEAHVEACPACARFQREHGRIEEGLQRLPEPALERLDVERASATLRRTLESSPGAPMGRLDPASNRPAHEPRRSVRYAGAAAVVILLTALGWGVRELVHRRGAAADVDRTASRVDRTERVAPGERATAAATGADERPDAPLGLADVRAACREHLAAAFAEGGAPDGDDDDGDPVDAALGRFDARTAVFHEDQWPLVRIVEDLVDDPDPGVARAAVRLVGRRGDRISVARLRAVLGRDELVDAAITALADRGDDGVEALAHAWRELDAHGPLVLSGLERVGGPVAAAAIAELAHDERDAARHAALLDALAATGPAAVRHLLRLAGDGTIERRDALARLECVPAAAAALGDVLARPESLPVPLLFEAAVRLQSQASLAWVEARGRDGVTRTAALDALARWDGIDPWRTLLRLYEGGRIGREEQAGVARALVERDATNVTAFARELVQADAASSASELLALLFACECEGTGPALVELALFRELPPDDRQWAALAVGELGSADDVDLLVRRASELGPDEHRLLAACLVSIHSLGGDAAVLSVLDPLPERSARRVVDALASATERPPVIGLHHVVRALDEAAAARRSSTRRTIP